MHVILNHRNAPKRQRKRLPDANNVNIPVCVTTSNRYHYQLVSDMIAGRSGKGHDPETKQGRTKRVRTIFTPEQLERMEIEFERQQYMVGTERLYLASTLGLSEAQVGLKAFCTRKFIHALTTKLFTRSSL